MFMQPLCADSPALTNNKSSNLLLYTLPLDSDHEEDFATATCISVLYEDRNIKLLCSEMHHAKSSSQMPWLAASDPLNISMVSTGNKPGQPVICPWPSAFSRGVPRQQLPPLASRPSDVRSPLRPIPWPK